MPYAARMTQHVWAVSSGASLLPVNLVLAVAVAVLLAVAVAVCHFGQLGHARAVLLAGLRAAVQLSAVSLGIGVVVRHVPLLALFVVLMFAVAVRTSGRRLTKGPTWWWTALPIAAGVVPIMTLLLVAGLLPPRGISVIPVAGILIGGALTATYLSGRRALDELAQRFGEVEAAMALGLLDREARLLVARDKAATALVPAIDQTRTVGLVTLPGAFVGMMLGGASPIAAGAVQLFVLIALLAIEAIATLLTLELVARGIFLDH
ncbi:putative ABC transport system permease protein [Actinomadura mexicana]|uniref:Putative ABC transport system permease protein n=2 Tax=Actinomadura mexicana TaxID=134959 RepID=A0A239H073_9ACTN|nr:putative ABC transport system permease protein [Actinomadura mexicana]